MSALTRWEPMTRWNPFKDLEELVRVCSEVHPHLVLEKVLVFALQEGEPCAVTLGFVSASKGQRPGGRQLVEE